MAKYKKTICVDFDGVIHSYSSGWKGTTNIVDPPTPGSREFLATLLNRQWDVVIFSTRARWFWGRMAIRSWIREHWESDWHEAPTGWPGFESIKITAHKPPALIYLDDRAVRFDGDFPKMDELTILEKPWNKLVVNDELKNIAKNQPVFAGDTLSHKTAGECGSRGWAKRDENGKWILTEAGIVRLSALGVELT